MKKLISIFLTFALCLSLCCVGYAYDTDYIISNDENSTTDEAFFSYTVNEELVPINQLLSSEEENNFTVDAGELYNPYTIKDIPIGVSMSRASLADLVLVSISSTVSQPFKARADVPFTIQIENRGTADAQNVMLAVNICRNLSPWNTLRRS